MTTYLPRSAWTNTGPRQRVSLVASRVKGVAVHWPGTTGKIGDPGQASIARRLEGYRRFHMNTRGWFDIAYQVAIDQAGRVWTLRGETIESGANGASSVNRTHGALLFLLGPGEQPSGAMVQAFKDWRTSRWLKHFPNATAVVGHGDIRPDPTACPGPATEALIRSGALTGKGSAPAKPAASKPTTPSKPASSKGLNVKLIDLRNAHRSLVRGPGVKPLQRLLGVKADGLAGPDTKAALGRAQKRAGVAADYMFGPNTAEAFLAGKGV